MQDVAQAKRGPRDPLEIMFGRPNVDVEIHLDMLRCQPAAGDIGVKADIVVAWSRGSEDVRTGGSWLRTVYSTWTGRAGAGSSRAQAQESTQEE